MLAARMTIPSGTSYSRPFGGASEYDAPKMAQALGRAIFTPTGGTWYDQPGDNPTSAITSGERGYGNQIKAGSPLTYRPLLAPTEGFYSGSQVGPVATILPPIYGASQSRFEQTGTHTLTPVSPSMVPYETPFEPNTPPSTGGNEVYRSGSGPRQGTASYGNTYNETAFDGPYLITRYDMGGVQQSRVFGVDYPYNLDQNPDLASQVKSGSISASGYFNAVMYNNKINDVDQIMSSTFRFTNAPNVSAGFAFTY